MFFHFAILMIISREKGEKFDQNQYDSLFYNIENNLRELGHGDVSVNKKMKDLNKIFYDILLKINKTNNNLKINKNLIIKYFPELNDLETTKYELFNEYLINFYDFCFELHPETMIKDALKFKV